MTLLTWNHACSTGVQAMDDQHGILMDTINDLRLAMTRGSDKEQIGALAKRLIEFTQMHFSSEEQLMEQSGFPGLAEHRAAHNELLDKLRNGAHSLLHSEDVRVKALFCSLHDGFMSHVETLDRQYGPWLNARGVS